jgi:hypothetical protein
LHRLERLRFPKEDSSPNFSGETVRILGIGLTPASLDSKANAYDRKAHAKNVVVAMFMRIGGEGYPSD